MVSYNNYNNNYYYINVGIFNYKKKINSKIVKRSPQYVPLKYYTINLVLSLVWQSFSGLRGPIGMPDI